MSDDSNKGGGYGKPPKHTQFKKGKSGNPGGRPKGSRNVHAIFDTALDARMTVAQNGRRRKISKRQAAMIQTANKGASGDLRAIQIILEHQNRQKGEGAPTPLNTQDDEVVFAEFLARLTPDTSDKEQTS